MSDDKVDFTSDDDDVPTVTRSLPDKNGVITETWFGRDERGQICKKERKIVKQLVPKGVAERKKWQKFGKAKQDGPYSQHLGEQIVMHLQRSEYETELVSQPKIMPSTEKYVPKHRRSDFAKKPGMITTDERRSGRLESPKHGKFSVHIDNLPQDTTHVEIKKLVMSFQAVRPVNVYVPKDNVSGLCRGFAFVEYDDEQVVQNIISRVDGFGYMNLRLRAAISAPRRE
jgi:hypothetical protein